MARMRNKTRSFTLLEIVVVVILIGILASLSVPSYVKAKEGSYNKEAKAILSLIGQAEKMSNLENGTYPGCTDIADCNQELNLNIPNPSSRAWNFAVQQTGGGTGFNAQATRRAADNRVWSLDESDQEPACGGGYYCAY